MNSQSFEWIEHGMEIVAGWQYLAAKQQQQQLNLLLYCFKKFFFFRLPSDKWQSFGNTLVHAKSRFDMLFLLLFFSLLPL